MNEVRFIAEWEPQESVLIALPHKDTDWDYILPEATDQYRRLIRACLKAGARVIALHPSAEQARSDYSEFETDDHFLIIETPTNDTWTRDYGFITVEKHGELRALDFGFNGWGLKFASDKDNLANLHLHNKSIIAKGLYRNNRDFTLEGGSVESDGEGTVLTTSRCLCSPNRNGGKTKAELNEILARRLGATHVLWLDYGALEGDDTDSHIDTLARLCPGHTILFTGCRDESDPHFEELLEMRAQLTMFRNAEGNAYNLLELPLPDPITDENGERLPATYANYLVFNDYILMPSYGQPAKDLLASQIVRVAFPGREVLQVDCTTLIRQHGSLHCATMQVPAGVINKIL